MYRRLLEYALGHFIKTLNAVDVDENEKKVAYERLWENREMMKALQAMMVADTKEMMKRDCMRSEFVRGMRYGLFMRSKSIFDKANKFYKERKKK